MMVTKRTSTTTPAAPARNDGRLVDAARRLEESGLRAQERVQEAAERVKNQAGDLASGVKEMVRAHPGRSILISVGVGAFLGMLFGRK